MQRRKCRRGSQRTSVGWHYIAPGKPHADRLHRELQRTVPRLVSERGAFLDPERCPQPNRRMEGRLQPTQSPFRLGKHPTGGDRPENETGKDRRIGPEISPRTLRKIGGEMELRPMNLRQKVNALSQRPARAASICKEICLSDIADIRKTYFSISPISRIVKGARRRVIRRKTQSSGA